jgi:hypothetical protein
VSRVSRLFLCRSSLLSAGLAVAVAVVGALGCSHRSVAHAQGPTWRQLPSPGAVYGALAIADLPRHRMVLEGGETDQGTPPHPARQLDLAALTWRDWVVTGDVPASARLGRGLIGSSAALDPEEGVVLAVCDCVGGGAFELDLPTDRWSRAQGSAGQLVSAGLLYDPAADRAIAFGGREYGLGDILTRTLAYDMSPARTGWSALPPVPFQLQDQALAVEPGGRFAYAFGGQDQMGNAHDALWRLDLGAAAQAGAWTLEPATGPAPRMGASLAFWSDHQAVLFGGYADGEHLADAWLLDTKDPDAPTWSLMTFSGVTPPARAAHAAAWDPEGGRLLVAGGTSGSELTLEVLGDAWALEKAPQGPARLFLPLALRNGAP